LRNKFVLLWWWLLAVLFPIGVTWIPFFIINSTRYRALTLRDELFTLILQSFFVAAPFVIVAIWTKKKLMSCKPNNRKAVLISGLIVLILYSLLVGWFLIDSFTRKTGGANIGVGLLLMASPFILPVVMIVTYQILKQS
jgi:hypothetical protein